MSDALPEGWAVCKLREVVATQKGKKPSELRKDPAKGFVPYLDICAIETGEIRQYAHVPTSRISDGAELFMVWDGARSGWTGKGQAGAVGSTIMAMKPVGVDTNYLKSFLDTQFETINTNTRGTGIPHVDPGYLWEIDFPIAPLAEQKRIVAKLEKVLEKVDASRVRLDKIPTLLKRFRQSVLAATCSGKLTADWREENETESSLSLLEKIKRKQQKWLKEQASAGNREARRMQTKLEQHEFEAPLSGLPNDWAWSSLLKVCWLVVDCHNKTAPYDPQGIPLIRTTNVRNGRLLLDEVKYISDDTYAFWSRRCPPESGDILFSREAPMGECAVIPSGLKVCMGQRMMLFRTHPDCLLAKYLSYAIQDPTFQQRMDGHAVGSGVKHLRVGDVERLVVAVPPFPEQQEIVRRSTLR